MCEIVPMTLKCRMLHEALKENLLKLGRAAPLD